MGRWSERWKTIHLAMAPFGVILATWLLTLSVNAWRWNHRDDLGFAGTLTPLGAAAYGAAVLTIEGGIRMFWALAQIEKDRKTFREEGRVEGEAAGRAEGEAVGRAEGEAVGRAKGEAVGRAEGRQELAQQIRAAATQSGRLLPEEVDQILAQVFNGESGNHQSAPPGARRTNTRRRRQRK